MTQVWDAMGPPTSGGPRAGTAVQSVPLAHRQAPVLSPVPRPGSSWMAGWYGIWTGHAMNGWHGCGHLWSEQWSPDCIAQKLQQSQKQASGPIPLDLEGLPTAHKRGDVEIKPFSMKPEQKQHVLFAMLLKPTDHGFWSHLSIGGIHRLYASSITPLWL